MQKQESLRENETYKILKDSEIKNGSPNPGQNSRPHINKQQKSRTCSLFYLASRQVSESEKKAIYGLIPGRL